MVWSIYFLGFGALVTASAFIRGGIVQSVVSRMYLALLLGTERVESTPLRLRGQTKKVASGPQYPNMVSVHLRGAARFGLEFQTDVIASHSVARSTYGPSNVGICPTGTYQGACSAQKMLACGRISGSESKSPLWTTQNF